MKRRALIALFTLTMTAAMIAGCGNSPNHNLTEENGQESPAEASEETDSHIEEAGEETTSDLERESGDETASGESEASNQAEPEADPDGAVPKEGTAASTEAGSQTADYTVTVMNAIMYAKNAVNLRQGPGTAYSKVGSLRKGDQVIVTGRADSGWYQLDSGAFVSDKYLDSKAPEATPADTTAPGMSADPATVLPVTIPASIVSTGADFLNYLNQQRSAAGLATLRWDDGMAAVAQRRAQEITKVFDHSGNAEQYGEIIQQAISGDVTEWYTNWFNSDAHRSSMMAKYYTRAGVGVYNVGNNYYVVCNFESDPISEEELLEQHKPENLIPAGGNENGTVNGFSTTGETLESDDPDYGFIYDLIEQERKQYNK